MKKRYELMHTKGEPLIWDSQQATTLTIEEGYKLADSTSDYDTHLALCDVLAAYEEWEYQQTQAAVWEDKHAQREQA